MRAAPAVSCANMCKEAHTSIQVQTEQSGIPCAMVLRLMPCSPRRRIRLVTVACRSGFGRTRLGSKSLRKLGTSNGCRDHTVLPYARYVVRPARRGVAHEPTRPANTRSRRRSRVHRIPSRVRDDARSAPLAGTRRRGRSHRFEWRESEIFLRERDWPTQIILKCLNKSYFTRNGYSAPRPHEHARMQADLPRRANQRFHRHHISTSAAHKSQSSGATLGISPARSRSWQ